MSEKSPPLGGNGIHSLFETDNQPTTAISPINSTTLTLSSIDKVTVNVRNLSITVEPLSSNSILGRIVRLKTVFTKSSKSNEATTEFNSQAENQSETQSDTIHFQDNSNDLEKSIGTATNIPDVLSSSRKNILQDISVDIPAGSLMAIIGGSGSGKTSLLNVMANRMGSRNLKCEGYITFNGNPDINKVRNAYVMQQDVLQPNLTCRETLQYAAELRLPSSTTQLERKALVEEIILELGLKECAGTLVGDTAHKGLSGGEKRRLSIGIQLLANPSVLFLDEPTTGLDANSAFLLVETCKKLVRKGRTIIMSIHQPRSDIFFLFDSVTILTKGQSVYSGPVRDVIPYIEQLGYAFPTHMNPADFLIDLSAVDTRTAEQEMKSKAIVNRLLVSWKTAQSFTPIEEIISSDDTSPSSSTSVLAKAPLSREIKVLTKRSFIISGRDPMGLAGLFVECVLMGTICGWIFFKLDGTIAGIRSMEGLLYTACAAQGYLILLYETFRLCGPDLRVFDREYNDGCVGPFGYLISRRLSKLFTEDLYVPFIFSAIVYYMAGLRTDSPRHFFIFFANTLLQQHIAVAFATLSASISRDFTSASLVCNLGFTLQSMACGFFVNATTMPVYVRWTKWIAYVYYAFGINISNQFTDWSGDCPFELTDPRCDPFQGEYVLQQLGVRRNWILVPMMVNIGWAVGFYIVAYIFLKYIRVSVSVSKSFNTKKIEEVAVPLPTPRNDNSNIDVDLNDLRLSVIRRQRLGLRTRNIPILQGITATFVPGSINAILGPSGSGKSSLLNLLADRLHSSFNQKYVSSGDIIFNGKLPSKSLMRSLCSYVTQEDDGLLPSLTVRETLYFAADLRLPGDMPREEKRARANEIILKMGLKDCADTLIGGEFVKGISGGEKRRVTISIQLLNDPKILLLDEPTSGLDSFIASSILQVLKALAEEGRTIICTIHQPRSDLFAQFGNILLLAKGGKVAYNGKSSDMLDYFASLNHPCPGLTNPADFVLDLVSVNLQSEEKESVSRLKVTKLLENWQTIESPVLSNVNEYLDSSAAQREFSSHVRKQTPFLPAYKTLLRRSTLNFSRSPHMIVARIMQVAGIGIIFALFFAPLKSDIIGVTNRLGLTQEITALYFVGMLNNMAIYPYDRSVFYREHDDNVYGVLPFFLVYLTLEVPFECITSIIFAIFLVLVPGLPRTPEMFFSCAYAALAIVNCGESIGIIFNTLFLHEGFAVNIISVILSIGCLMAGIMSLNMPGFLKGLNWISPLKYAVSVMINESFKDQTFSCEGQALDADGGCEFDTGVKVLENYGLTANVPAFLGGLAVAVIVYRLLAFTVLKINRLKLGMKSLSRNKN